MDDDIRNQKSLQHFMSRAAQPKILQNNPKSNQTNTYEKETYFSHDNSGISAGGFYTSTPPSMSRNAAPQYQPNINQNLSNSKKTAHYLMKQDQ